MKRDESRSEGRPSPSWETIKKSLVAKGLMTEDGDSRRARVRLCAKCSLPVMAGLDDDRCADLAVCDPAPINTHGELYALVTGRCTYRLRFMGGKYVLNMRDQWQITASPAGSPELEVLAGHKCNEPLAPEYHKTIKPIAKAKVNSDNDIAPF